MLLTRIVLISVFLSLAACASSPRYVAADNAEDYGYYARKIGNDRYRVNFNGGRHTDLQDTRDYALLRAAEITVADGYDWFQVVDRETATTTRETAEPRVGFGYERAYYVDERCAPLSCTRSMRPSASFTSVEFGTDRTQTRYSHSLEIVLGKGKMPEDGNYYDAKEVMKSIYDSI